MNLIRKGQGHAHRGVIGVEAAIVMIAFVIVAAALAFVVLNMGFTTTQKAKTSIISGLAEASSALEIDGTVVGVACYTGSCGSNPILNATGIPIKVTSGGSSVNLDPAITAVSAILNSVEYSDIYSGVITSGEAISLQAGFEAATVAGYLTVNPVNDTAAVTSTVGFVYFPVADGTPDNILEKGEHAVLAVAFESSDRPSTLDTMRFEIITGTGATLTVEREIPTLETEMINLG